MFSPGAPTADYALTWPPEAFRGAAARLAREWSGSAADEAEAVWLLEDAFHGEAPALDLRSVSSFQVITARQKANPRASSPAEALVARLASASAVTGDPRQQYLSYLAEVADRLPLHAPVPFWSVRAASSYGRALDGQSQDALQGQPRFQDRERQDLDDERSRRLLQIQWAAMVEELRRKGYLARVAPPRCDRDGPDEPDADYWLELETARQLGTEVDIWPLRPGWTDPLFFDLVELVHDLVARPRGREVVKHRGESGWCWHFDLFDVQTGQDVYRWQVDRLFTRHDVGLKFSADPGTAGRLVRLAGDDRDELVRRALASPDHRDRAEIQHAVGQFRDRNASRQTKRSATAALGRILEDRRGLLKAELLSKDEGALFQIANQFDIRHRSAGQRSDYDDAYLDWVFWWYLATVELTDRLLARQRPATGPATP